MAEFSKVEVIFEYSYSEVVSGSHTHKKQCYGYVVSDEADDILESGASRQESYNQFNGQVCIVPILTSLLLPKELLLVKIFMSKNYESFF